MNGAINELEICCKCSGSLDSYDGTRSPLSSVTTTGSAGAFGELTAPLFQASRSEIVINRCASEVWAVLADLSCQKMKLWNPLILDVRRISGEPRKVGECVLVTMNAEIAPCYMRTIRIVPNKLRVSRCDATDGSYATFVDYSLYELDEKSTRVICNLYGEIRIPGGQVKTFSFTAATESIMSYLDGLFEKLKTTVERGLVQSK